MIKLIAFDFGDVLVRDTFKTLKRKFGQKHLSAPARQRYFRALDNINVGRIDEYELIRELHGTIVPQLSLSQIHKVLLETNLLAPWQLAHKLKRRYKIAIWTNNHKTGPAEFSKILHTPFAEFPIITSAYIKAKKPDSLFYRKAMRQLGMKPNEVLFIDDSLDNVQGARRVGIAAFRYQHKMRPLKAFLKKHGVSGL
jgi:putative hydrolase of the HAD superfamily